MTALDEIRRFMERLGPINDEIPAQFRCGRSAHVAIRLAFPARWDKPLPSAAALYGVPVIVDEAMGPDKWQLLAGDGKILASGAIR